MKDKAGIFKWRRGRDLNPRYGFNTVYRISSAALSTTQAPLQRRKKYSEYALYSQ